MIIVIRMYDEEWKPLKHPQIKDIYEISNYGRIRRRSIREDITNKYKW